MKIQTFFLERNTSKTTQKNYLCNIKSFENTIGLSIDEMLETATQENRQDWQDTHLRQWLIQYRNHCYNTYKESTAEIYLIRIRTIFKHYNITLGELPYFSKKQVNKSDEIDYEDLPDREVLSKCIELKDPLLKAITLFMSSAGTSKIDTWNLTIEDYLTATNEYHNAHDITNAISEMEHQELDIIPVFKLHRQKTGETYRTFCSPEAVTAINMYLRTRENISNSDRLFDVSFRYVNALFAKTNDLLHLGRINGFRRFTPQMLRRYHATQLAEAGVNDSYIDLLQGRKPQSIARKSYIRVKRERLKEEYVRALPFLVVQEIEKVKTELEVTKDKLEEKDSELAKVNSRLASIEDKIRSLESTPRSKEEILRKVTMQQHK